MDPQKLEKQLDDLWAKMGTGGMGDAPASTVGVSPDFFAAERDLMRDTLGDMRRRFAQEKGRWERLLAQRDELNGALRGEKERLDGELDRLGTEVLELRSELETQLQLRSVEEAERKAELERQISVGRNERDLYNDHLQNAEEAHRREISRFESLLGRRQEQEKVLRQTLEQREGQISDLKTQIQDLGLAQARFKAEKVEEFRKGEEAHREALRGAAAENQTLKESLELKAAEGKNLEHLLEGAQADIVQYSRQREALERELKSTAVHAGRLENDLKNLRLDWESERGQWRELWERERASRERWQEQMRQWEDHLRKERQEWLEQFKTEQTVRQKAGQVLERNLERLREAVWTFPIFPGRAGAPRPAGDLRVSGTGTASPAASIPAGDGPAVRLWRALSTPARRWGAPALAGVLGTALCLGLFTLLARPREYPSPVTHPGGVAARGDRLWYSDWMTGQIFQASALDPSAIESQGEPDPRVHPVALRWAGDRLWSLDTWARCIREHQAQPPFSVMKTWPLNLSEPVDFAWDGQGFWILDRANQTLSRFGLGDFQRPDRHEDLPPGWRLTAVDFRDGNFWGYDDAAKTLRRFVTAPQWEMISSISLKAHLLPASPLTGLALSDQALWTLSEKSLTVYRWKWWTLFRPFSKAKAALTSPAPTGPSAKAAPKQLLP